MCVYFVFFVYTGHVCCVQGEGEGSEGPVRRVCFLSGLYRTRVCVFFLCVFFVHTGHVCVCKVKRAQKEQSDVSVFFVCLLCMQAVCVCAKKAQQGQSGVCVFFVSGKSINLISLI